MLVNGVQVTGGSISAGDVAGTVATSRTAPMVMASGSGGSAALLRLPVMPGDVVEFQIDGDDYVDMQFIVAPSAESGASITTLGASITSDSSVTLNGAANPNGTDTLAYFRFGTDTTYGTVIPSQDVGSGTGTVPFSASIQGLTRDRIYHYQAVGVSVSGTLYGADQTIVISSLAFTDTATGVNSFSVGNLWGHVSSGAPVTSAYFESGTDTTYGITVAATNDGGSVYYSPAISGLSRDTTYHYRFDADVNGIIYHGVDHTFTTTQDDPCYAINRTYYLPVKPASSISLDVLAGDTVTNPADTLTVSGFSRPAGGNLQLTSGSTALIYTPSSRYTGHDSFTYTISTGYGETSTATVYIVNPYINYAGNYQGLVPNNGTPGYLTLTLGQQGSFTGSLKTLGGSYSFAGSLSASGTAVATLTAANKPNLKLNISLNFNNSGNGSSGGSSSAFTFTLSGSGGLSETGNFTPKVLYSTTNPAPETGKYTIIIPPPAQTGTSQATATATVVGGKITGFTMGSNGSGYLSAPTVTITSTKGSGAAGIPVLDNYGGIYGYVSKITLSNSGSGYTTPVTVTISPPSGLPQGTGWATMTVANTGAVSITGKLGDGTAFTAGSWIDQDYSENGGSYYYYGYEYYNYGPQTFPVFANVYTSPAGYIDGTMTFEDNVNVSDFDGSLSWYKPAQTTAQSYSEGFTLSLTMLGSAYGAPTTNDYIVDTTTGVALLTLSGGNLVSQLQNSLTLLPAPQTGITAVTGSSDSLSVTSVLTTGAFTGSFKAPGATTTTPFSGVYFQKQNLGLGVFSGSSQTGNVNISPQ